MQGRLGFALDSWYSVQCILLSALEELPIARRYCCRRDDWNFELTFGACLRQIATSDEGLPLRCQLGSVELSTKVGALSLALLSCDRIQPVVVWLLARWGRCAVS